MPQPGPCGPVWANLSPQVHQTLRESHEVVSRSNPEMVYIFMRVPCELGREDRRQDPPPPQLPGKNEVEWENNINNNMGNNNRDNSNNSLPFIIPV